MVEWSYNLAHHVLNLIINYNLVDKANSVVFKQRCGMTLSGSKPPSNGWVKLNADGTCRDNGVWLGRFAKRIGKCSAYMVELWERIKGWVMLETWGFEL